MVTEKVYKTKQRTRTQEWCQPALLPEIHVPIMQKCSPGGAAIRGDQGTDRPAQWVLKTQAKTVFCFLLPLSCFMFSCFMFPVSCFMFHVSYVLVAHFHNFVTSNLLRLPHLIQIYQTKIKTH